MGNPRIWAAAIGLAGTLGALAWASQAQAAQIMSRTCNVDQIGVFTNRIHIKCVPIQGTAYTNEIEYYAMAITSDARVIDNVIALAIGAKQTNKPLVIQFDMDDYKSVPGCQGHDCRKLTGAALE
jgi:hypothetical protein